MGGATIGGRRYMTSATSASDLFYDLFQDPGLSVAWDSYGNAGTGVQMDLVLNGAGQGNVSRPIYAKIYSGQQTAGVGNYTAAFQGDTANLTYAEDTALSCNAIGTNETPVNFYRPSYRGRQLQCQRLGPGFRLGLHPQPAKDRDSQRLGAMQRQCALYGGISMAASLKREIRPSGC